MNLAVCPFCKGIAEMKSDAENYAMWVECSQCGASTPQMHDPDMGIAEERAASLWNSRPIEEELHNALEDLAQECLHDNRFLGGWDEALTNAWDTLSRI